MTQILKFPDKFLWGCGTAAHQVEGGLYNDWTEWERVPGRIFQNHRVGDACNWWAGKYLEDFDRAAQLHNNVHRFSIEWSRIEPTPGQWDEYALTHYLQMAQALRARGITPLITLHHFTNPVWLAKKGGWLSDETPTLFARYVGKVVETFGDVCQLWCTINEPMVYALASYFFGAWVPGIKSAPKTLRVITNLLRGHVAAYDAIKAIQPSSQVGLAYQHVGFRAQELGFINRTSTKFLDNLSNYAFLASIRDGVLRFPFSPPIKIANAKNKIDWIGLQYYKEFSVSFSLKEPQSLFMPRIPQDMPVGPGLWGGLNPSAIFNYIEWLQSNFDWPIYITEVGVPDPTDTIRPKYLIETVRAIWEAIQRGYDVRGMLFWTLLDNFEWGEGYNPDYNFGLYAINFVTQQRVPRQSAFLYQQICANNGLPLELLERYLPNAQTNGEFPYEHQRKVNSF